MMLYYVRAAAGTTPVSLVLSAEGVVYYAALEAVTIANIKTEFAKLTSFTVEPVESFEGDTSPINHAVTEYCNLVRNPLVQLKDRLKYEIVFGTAAQHRVWKQLVQIPPGTTSTYTDITKDMGLPLTHVRAVANACGANRLALIVPCHRVLRKGGDISGYRWGVFLKRQLLRNEAMAKSKGNSHRGILKEVTI